TVGTSGAPFGAQTAMPLWITTGWPMANTRRAPTTHFPVTQGACVNGQPATEYGAATVATACPLTITRSTGAVGSAWPPCPQRTVAPRCRIAPGISGHREGLLVHVDRRAGHEDRGADQSDGRPFAVRDVNAGVARRDHRAERRLDEDSARGP